MDPQATLNELLQEVDGRDWERVEELAEALLHWMEQRGFPLLTLGPQSLGRGWHQAIATSVSRLAQSKVREARQRRRKGGDRFLARIVVPSEGTRMLRLKPRATHGVFT